MATKKSKKNSQLSLKFYVGADNEHRWTLFAANGNVLAASTQGYKRKAMATKNAATVITAGANPSGLKIILDGEAIAVDILQFIETAKKRK